MEKDLRVAAIAVIAAVVLVAALGYYFVTVTAVRTSGPSAIGGNTQPYRIFIVAPMDMRWNSTTSPPRFFVMGPNRLESSASLSVPANTLIQLTIVSYDTPTPGATNQEGKVTGTINNSAYVINGTTASMANVNMQWGMNVTSLPASSIAHTFTIPTLEINIPVPADTHVIQ